jgi:hypothetical protein
LDGADICGRAEWLERNRLLAERLVRVDEKLFRTLSFVDALVDGLNASYSYARNGAWTKAGWSRTIDI